MTFPTESQAREFLRTMLPKVTNVVVVPTTHGYWVITSTKEAERPTKVCSICHQRFYEFANNARPINSGQCCAYCDDHVVTPARIRAQSETLSDT